MHRSNVVPHASRTAGEEPERARGEARSRRRLEPVSCNLLTNFPQSVATIHPYERNHNLRRDRKDRPRMDSR
jgi:hypothetical protein